MSGARLWTNAWSVAAACGVGLATWAWSPVAALAAVLTASFCAGLLTLTVWSVSDSLRPDGGVPWRRLVPRALAAGAGVVTFLVLAEWSASLALLCLGLCCLPSPAVLRRVRRSSPDRSSASRQAVGTHVADPVPRRPDGPAWVRELGDEELCRLWRATYWQLGRQTSEAGLLDLVVLRQAFLDELERRDPAALQAWLSSGARASGGPERFWSHDDKQQGSADAA